jgi:3-hydroxymyristoyl/3-hydroxydecanoyl-(acyl carrier protein) dehydratase
MGDHFSAFSFGDRIHDYVPGERARATFAIPAHLKAFPSCLIAEAVGQLASWIAMAHIEFRGRPVAALALETRFLRDAQPGETLELAVELESCDDDAVAYHGWADIDGARALDLIDCLGPMLPLTEFDSPAALRERFGVLCSTGAHEGRFPGISDFRVEPGMLDRGRSATATLYVPDTAPFFRDHFPRRPVFPATLLLNEMIQLALQAEQGATNGHLLVPVRMTNVKVRTFTPPGQVVLLCAELDSPNGGMIVASLTARAHGRMVATARVDLADR